MSERRILLDTAAFLETPRAEGLGTSHGLSTAQVRQVVERFLECAYLQVGKSPRLLEGDELREILLGHLPRMLPGEDLLARGAPGVVEAFLAHLGESAWVPHLFELRRVLAEAGPGCSEAVRARKGPPERIASGEATRPIVNRAPRVGRNEPCPCGSGRKFKHCCARIGS